MTRWSNNISTEYLLACICCTQMKLTSSFIFVILFFRQCIYISCIIKSTQQIFIFKIIPFHVGVFNSIVNINDIDCTWYRENLWWKLMITCQPAILLTHSCKFVLFPYTCIHIYTHSHMCTRTHNTHTHTHLYIYIREDDERFLAWHSPKIDYLGNALDWELFSTFLYILKHFYLPLNYQKTGEDFAIAF